MPAPPSSTGPRGPDVPDALAAYYPGGDPEGLRAAAACWSTVADRMGRITAAGDTAFRQFTDTGDGAAFSAMRTFWATRFTPCATEPLFNAVVNGAGTLRDACGALAELIEHTRAEVRGAAAEAVEDMAPLELPAKVLNKLAWNIPELELLIGTGALAVAHLDHARDAYRSALHRQVELLRPEQEQHLRRVAVPPAPDAPVGVGLTDIGQIAGLEVTGTAWDAAAGPDPTPDTIHITPQQVTHILTGDRAGGGHAPGAGFPGKTEFPRGWDEPEIVAAALSVARDPETITRSAVVDRWEAPGSVWVCESGSSSRTTATSSPRSPSTVQVLSGIRGRRGGMELARFAAVAGELLDGLGDRLSGRPGRRCAPTCPRGRTALPSTSSRARCASSRRASPRPNTISCVSCSTPSPSTRSTRRATPGYTLASGCWPR